MSGPVWTRSADHAGNASARSHPRRRRSPGQDRASRGSPRPCRAEARQTTRPRTWSRPSRPDPRPVRVVQGLARNLEADPLAEYLDLAARPDRRIRGQVRVCERALDGEPIAARRDPPDDVAADPYRLVTETDRRRIVE